MKDCVIFSCWIPIQSLQLGIYYLDILEKYHNSSDIIIGNNKNCCLEWYYELKKRNIFYVDYEGPDINSDVSGFIAGLRALKNRKDVYKNIWFGHTKGSSYSSINSSLTYRTFLENNFWNKKEYIDGLFDDETVGLVANHYIPHNNKNIDLILNSFYDFKINEINIFVANTFYILDYKSTITFLNSSRNFFDMVTINNMHDKCYFFEAYFCVVPLKLGKRHISL